MKDYDSTSISARRWSEQVLDISDGVDRTRLLRHLTDFDYVVPAEHVDAMQVLVNPTGPSLRWQTIERADLEGRRDRLTSAVAGFARSYFETQPPQRRSQWETLHHQCEQFPVLLRWLDALAPALDIERVPHVGDEVLNRVVEHCCRAFVARDPARARQRQEFILLYCQDPFRWLAAIRRLVSVEPRFTAKVAPWLVNLPDAINLDRDRKQTLSPLLKPIQPKSTKQEKEGAWSGAAFAVFVLIGALIRPMLRSGLGPNDHNPPRSYQSRTEFDFGDEDEQKKRRENAQMLQRIMEKHYHRQVIEMTPPVPAGPEPSRRQVPETPPPPAMPEE